jgi:hypothetical protein
MRRAVAQHSSEVTALIRGHRPGHLRMLMLTHSDVLAVATRRANPARMTHGRSSDRVRGASSASPRLTAKLTAKPHDTRDPQGMTMDADTRPEVRRCDWR